MQYLFLVVKQVVTCKLKHIIKVVSNVIRSSRHHADPYFTFFLHLFYVLMTTFRLCRD